MTLINHLKTNLMTVRYEKATSLLYAMGFQKTDWRVSFRLIRNRLLAEDKTPIYFIFFKCWWRVKVFSVVVETIVKVVKKRTSLVLSLLSFNEESLLNICFSFWVPKLGDISNFRDTPLIWYCIFPDCQQAFWRVFSVWYEINTHWVLGKHSKKNVNELVSSTEFPINRILI